MSIWASKDYTIVTKGLLNNNIINRNWVIYTEVTAESFISCMCV